MVSASGTAQSVVLSESARQGHAVQASFVGGGGDESKGNTVLASGCGLEICEFETET
jgi:hypothetical protein